MENKSIKEEVNDNIITIEEIQAILSEYRIGKKPLAKLLGWGETTIIRYIEGDIPTNEYSDKLKTIHGNPNYYYEILQKNKDNLTGVAYKKSKKAVLSKLMESKLSVVAQYIINISNAEISPSTIQLLLHYVQGFSLVLYDAPIFNEDYEITYNSMPYPKLYNNMKSYGLATLELGEGALTDVEKTLITNVYEAFSWYGPKALVAMSSGERVLLRISRDKFGNKVIAKDTIKSYFKDILDQFEINNVREIYKYPDKRFVDIRGL